MEPVQVVKDSAECPPTVMDCLEMEPVQTGNENTPGHSKVALVQIDKMLGRSEMRKPVQLRSTEIRVLNFEDVWRNWKHLLKFGCISNC